ncbi:hypothetical protein U1Q18_004687 [Sarracenia purpurea var. burkii]
MENMQYAEELVKEFLVFRGFTSTLQAFERELGTDIGKGFQVDRILELIFSVYIPQFRAENLIAMLSFFKQCFSSASEILFISTLSKLEVSILRYYVVHATQSGRRDKVMELFEMHGNDLLQRNHDWTSWFAIPYLKNPNLDPQFRMYFSQECNASSAMEASMGQENSATNSVTWTPLGGGHEEGTLPLRVSHETGALVNERESAPDWVVTGPAVGFPEMVPSKFSRSSSSTIENLVGESGRTNDTLQMYKDGFCIENSTEMQGEEGFPEVKVEFQVVGQLFNHIVLSIAFRDLFDMMEGYGHMTQQLQHQEMQPSTVGQRSCRLNGIANQTAWCLLIGTADGGIKAWNVDAKRVVCDLTTTEAFPSVLDLKCSPVEPIFVSAASSRGYVLPMINEKWKKLLKKVLSFRHGAAYEDKLGFASLTVWNMKTWKAMSVLPLGEDPPAITSLCFNHNGKILAAAATDGMIHMFDMSAGLQITGWPAHDSAISSVLFGPDETSIFSLGIDGKVLQS